MKSDPPDNNTQHDSPGLFLLESFGVPGGNAGGAFLTCETDSDIDNSNNNDSDKKYLTDEEREKLKDKKIHVHLQG